MNFNNYTVYEPLLKFPKKWQQNKTNKKLDTCKFNIKLLKRINNTWDKSAISLMYTAPLPESKLCLNIYTLSIMLLWDSNVWLQDVV